MDSPSEVRAAAVGYQSFAERIQPTLLQIGYAITGSAAEALDLTQDCLLTAFQRWPSVASMTYPEAWARRVLMNKALSTRRRVAREATAFLRLGRRPQPFAELELDDAAFWRVVRRLPNQQLRSIVLFYVEDLPVAEIAAHLDCSPSTVRVHLHRARAKLASELKEAYNHVD